MHPKLPGQDSRVHCRRVKGAPRGLATTRLVWLALAGAAVLIPGMIPGPAAAFDDEPAVPTIYQEGASKLSLATDSEFGKSVHAIAVQRGKTTVVETAFRVSRVAVGSPKIADFVAISDREIEILAREPGDTNMLIWGEGRLQAVIDIHVEGVQPHIVRELSRILDNESIRVDVAGGSVILRGHVPDLAAFEAATRIASAYLARGREMIGGEQDTASRPEVINLLEVGGGQQVMIEVVIAELRRNISRSLGVNLAGKAGSGGQAGTFQSLIGNLSTNPALMGSGTGPAGGSTMTEAVTLAGSYFSTGGLDLRLFLEALEASQLGTILAEPNVVARSGQEANFLVGGEVPIPTTNSLTLGVSQMDIDYKTFGVNVEFLPTVMSKNRIHLRVTPEVSEPDFTLGVTVLGTSVPAFQTRRVHTSVEVGDGESFVLAGLLREDIVASLDEVPFLANVPILGQLFKSRAFQKKQTELVLFVTPHIVQPLAPGTKIPLPTDAYIEPTMAEFYWDGRIEGRGPIDGSKVKEDEQFNEDAWGANPEVSDVLALEGGSKSMLDVAHNGSPGHGTAAYAEEPPYAGAASRGGFIGPFGHRLRVPKPVGVGDEEE